jgi:hypothetical protein
VPGFALGTGAMTTVALLIFSAALHPTAPNWQSPYCGSLTSKTKLIMG